MKFTGSWVGEMTLKKHKVLESKEIENLSKEPPSGAFNGVFLPLTLGRGWSRRTSQEGVTEKVQATETKISNKVGQGNPVWVQLCLHLTALREPSCCRESGTSMSWGGSGMKYLRYYSSRVPFQLCSWR